MTPNPGQTFNQAKHAFANGDFARALSLSDRLLDSDPDSTAALNLKAMSALGIGQPEAAAKTMARALKTASSQPGILINAARIQADMCQFSQARRLLNEASNAARNQPGILLQAAVQMRQCMDTPAALRLADHVIQKERRSAEAWWLKGSLLIDQGKNEAALSALEQSVQLQPFHARALSDWSRLVDSDSDRTRVQALLEQAARRHPQARDRATATFALGHMLHQAGEHAAAFEHFSRANEQLPENKKAIDQWHARLDEVDYAIAHHPEIVCHQTSNSPRSRGGNRVFIVGNPRSGTSLCEHMISAHPDAFGCGELPTMHYLEERLIRHGMNPWSESKLKEEQLQSLARDYENTLPAGAAAAVLSTDKAPLNFQRLGLIQRVFPASRFIHCQRHPLDTLLSVWFQDFHHGLAWSRSISTITDAIIREHKIMQQWSGLMGGQVLPFPYEQAVTDVAGSTQRLANFLELNPDETMTQPHQQEREVSTASNVQVRQEIHQRSVGYWRHYESHLGDALQRFTEAGLTL